ncbi:M14 family metallopeptidase [Nocardioides donggukensis]|uniref:Zinc carboxypeptidase n=1 Tax=Nocardioides donggukensis TaxID=2774019 RepID=A0A927K387_9ACTN|nr:M14 family metallopeptidase [Nocardioides donggukensis]MBD8868788.1 zinc carboxypeptidase [Nocardioides donggukensis]
MRRSRRTLRRAGLGVLGGTLAGLVAATVTPALVGPASGEPDRSEADEPTRIVMVDAPTVRERNRVVDLGLDLTERATRRGIEVVLHDAEDAETLRRAGFSWRVKVADLEKEVRANRRADRQYAAAVEESGLPSGRTAYRDYADYLSDLDALAAQYPTLTKPLTLENETVLGEEIRGLEVSAGADNVKDGKPVFLLMGAHHAREWPSSEHTIEFGFDLLQSYADGDARARRILSSARLVIVPVVNVDGFEVSREATPLGDFSLFDYEMKRKNCRISESTPARFTTGTCDDNPAGRLRGTDLNRNYPGFWGGGGASTNWSSDVFRGDSPGSEPESDAVREFISERAVTMMISNHTYGNLLLRPPAIAATGKAPDEPQLKAVADDMAAANDYDSQASYQLYDTSGSTEDWSYWITGGFGYTFEIGPDGFHPTYENAVVAEYLGIEPADGAGNGGNREAYYRAAEAAIDPALHSRITGTAPAKHTITVSKTHTSPTSPVIQPDGTVGDPILYEDTLTTSYASDGGRFTMDVNPSTRPLVAGRYGREAQADPQAPITLTNPAGVPGTREQETTTFEIGGLPEVDNGFATLTFPWPNGADWDFFVLGPDGEAVGSGATLANPEVIRIPDPVAGTYTVIAENYEGGSAEDDWSGEVTFQSPDPPSYTGIKEAWLLTCSDKRGNVVNTREVVVDRGETFRAGAACRRDKD